jgi:SAM-dependent methyltransferase
MFDHAIQRLQLIEKNAKPLLETLDLLRWLTLDEFGELLLTLPRDDLPHLSSILPGNTPEHIQTTWTGSAGLTLLRSSVSFMSFVASTFTDFCSVPFHSKNVLDFGCGWGRLLRLLAFFNDPAYNFGCDAWSVSLDHCRASHVDRVVARIEQSDAMPIELPFRHVEFDLVYAFSIFTHLPEAHAVACMSAIRRAIRPNGLAIITVRPIEYWDFNKTISQDERDALKDLHKKGMVAFYPHDGKVNDSDGKPSNYGHTSIPLAVLEEKFPGWTVVRGGNTLADPYQTFVVMRPI